MGQWNYGLCKIKPDSPDCPKNLVMLSFRARNYAE